MRTIAVLVPVLITIILLLAGCTSGGESELQKAGKGGSSDLPKLNFTYSEEKFEEALENGKPTILEFGANWCLPCRYMVPVVEEVKSERGQEVDIITVNGDQHSQLGARYGVRGYPTFVLFDSEGEFKGTVTGAKTEKELNAIIDQLLA